MNAIKKTCTCLCTWRNLKLKDICQLIQTPLCQFNHFNFNNPIEISDEPLKENKEDHQSINQSSMSNPKVSLSMLKGLTNQLNQISTGRRKLRRDPTVLESFLKSESSEVEGGELFWAGREDDLHRDLQGMARGRLRGGESWKGGRFRLISTTIAILKYKFFCSSH